MNEIDQLFIYGKSIYPKRNKKINYETNSTPLICGKKVSLKKALNYIKKLTYKEDIHFSNLGCDLKTYDKVIEISEKKKFSISHANEVEINNFYLALQKFGASIVSLAELKNRSDFVLIIGELEKSIFKSFIDFLDWKKKKISNKVFHLSANKNQIFENKIFKNDISDYFNSFNNSAKICNDQIYKSIIKAKYPVIVLSSSNEFSLNQTIFRTLYNLNKTIKNIKITRIGGLNNSAGFVNACLMKSGFPGSLNFTDWGISYEPFTLSISEIRKRKKIQFSVSNFSELKLDHKFKFNIFIGNLNFQNAKNYDIYIPTKTPGIDTEGLALRSDGNQIIKLRKKITTNYPENCDLLNEIFF